MSLTLEHPQGNVFIRELGDGRRHIKVELKNRHFDPSSWKSWTTHYPIDLIKEIFDLKGPWWLCEEIMREEDPDYVRNDLYYSLLSYVENTFFDHKRVIDFGCGCGASSMILARMFPFAQIIGMDIKGEALKIAESRAGFCNLGNVNFICLSTDGKLPEDTGTFDIAILSAVYEHLLPSERLSVTRQIWDVLNKGGVLFINQTPDRRFPVETHSSGLPLINYLPERVAFELCRKFSRRIPNNLGRNDLLRSGVRGATPSEIIRILSASGDEVMLLRPSRLGVSRQSDIFYKSARERVEKRWKGIKKFLAVFIFDLLSFTKFPLAPWFAIAIKKK